MSATPKAKERKPPSRKKRNNDANHSQGPPRSNGSLVTKIASSGVPQNGHASSGLAKAPVSDDDLLKTQLAQKIISMVYNGESEEKLIDVISLLVEETTVAEVEMLRQEVQNLKRMLHDATGMLQHVAKERSQSEENCAMADGLTGQPVDWEQRLQKEILRQKKRFQEENKREMDKLRLYFEKQCSQSQSDYISEIYALKLECQDSEQQRTELAKLRELCDQRNDLLQRLEDDHESVMREKRRIEQDAVQLHVTLMKMEKEKLASEERTKKILSAVRDGLHKLSDMKTDAPAEGAAREPGLSTFYNHVEEIITTDDWSDDDIYVKGVMEEIQVSVQKLSRPVRTPERSGPVDPEFISMSCQTDFLPSTPFGETDAIRLAFEARISGLQETGLLDKQNYEQSLSDFQQQVDRLKQKSLADKRFIDELSSDRESDREEMLKLTQTVEDAWRESERQTEKMALLQQTVGELETQLQTFSAHNSSLIITRTRLEEDLQAKNDHLRQREDLLNELERQLAERDSQASHHQKQLERLKMDLSGFLHSPPQSPEPSSNESSVMDFEDLHRQIMDLKDELEAKNRLQEAERDKRVHNLQEELEKIRRVEQRALRDCDSLQQQIEQQDLEIAVLRQQVDDAKFRFPDENVLDQLNSRVLFLQKETEGCHRVIEQLDSELHVTRVELESTRKSLQEKEAKLEQAASMISEDVIKEQMKEFESRNELLVQEISETAAMWEEQQKAWQEDVTRKTENFILLEKELSEKRDVQVELTHVRRELQETKKRLEQTESMVQEKTVQVQSFKNLLEIMKSEAAQKEIAVKAVQKQLNANSASLALQLEELQKSNFSMREEMDVYRNAPDRSAEIFQPLLRDKDAEISRLRDLLEASFDQSLCQFPQNDSCIQTEDLDVGVPVVPQILRASLDRSNAEVQTNGFLNDGESRDSGNNSKTPEPDSNLLTWNSVPTAEVLSAGNLNSISHRSDKVDVEIQADLENLQSLLAQMTSHKATIRELKHSVQQKETQIEAMALELASLSDRHGKTQTKHRTTIRYLNQSGQSSSDEGSTNSLPRSNLNGDAKQLIAKYEGKIRQLEKSHNEEIQLLVQQSLAVLQNQKIQEKSAPEFSPPSAETSMDDSITLVDVSLLSDTLQTALRELRNGSEAILKASSQLTSASLLQKSGEMSENGHDNWLDERDLLLGKIDFFRDTINQLVLSRDSMEMALRHMEQQNEDVKAELEMLKKEDEMADQGKDLLLSLLKKTEAELAELHARYRQRDLRLEIEQSGREREEREREKLQKELRETEVQLVRVRGELRQKDAQWEREKILTMWKKESEEAEHSRLSWRGKYLRAESYRKNLIHQKRYLVTLLDDVIINTNDDYIKQLALDGVRPTTTRRPPGLPLAQRKKSRFKTIAVVVCAVFRLRVTRVKWQQVRKETN